MSTDNEQNKNEKLAAELAKAKREIETLKREKRRVGLSFHRIPETGHDISRLWNGDFPYLQKLPDNCLEKSVTDETFHADANTVLIEADNLAALMAMQLTHKGQIDVIYIDPPYNTGNNDFIYNDARKSSIKDIEGASASDYEDRLDGKARTVGKDDPERHSLWLSFMERRLWLAKELLSPNGVIFVSIDDNEQAKLKVLLDSIFGEANFIANLIWTTKQGARGVPPVNMVMSNHEYILTYAIKKDNIRFAGVERNEDDFSNPDNDPRGLWRSESIVATGKQNNYFDIIDPSTGNIFNRNWAFSKSSIANMIEEGLILFPSNPEGTPRQKKFLNSYRNATKPFVTNLGWYSSENSTKEMQKMLGNGKFDFPKSVDLMKDILIQAIKENKKAVVLDFFAGSGTTAHAVAELNKKDGGSRQCILVTHGDEDGKNIAEDVTAERVKRVLSGENWADGKEHEPLIGSFYYYKLLFAPKTTNPLTAMETMQTRFTGLAAMEQDAHVQLENESNYTVLMNGEKIVVVWKNGDALLDEPEIEFYPLLERVKEENKGKALIVYTPSTSSSNSDEYGVSRYGWTNYSFPMEYIQAHDALLERMKRNKTMLQPYVGDTVAGDGEFVYTDAEVDKSDTETNNEDSEGIK